MVLLLLLIHVAQAVHQLTLLPVAEQEEDRVQQVLMEDPAVVLENPLTLEETETYLL